MTSPTSPTSHSSHSSHSSHLDDLALLDLSLGSGDAILDLSFGSGHANLDPARESSHDVPLDLSLGSGHELHLAGCAHCQAELRDTLEAVHGLILGLPLASPSPELRARVLAAVAAPLTSHAQVLAAMFDRSEAELRVLLARVQDGSAVWMPLMPGIDHHAIATGSGIDGGLVRVAPGVRFPNHHHHQDERLRVLQGSCTDSSGLVLGPGDELHHTVGTAHALTIHRGQPLVLAYLGGQIEFTGASA